MRTKPRTRKALVEEVEKLTAQILTCRELRDYDLTDMLRLQAKAERYRAALKGIDGINDNPAHFNSEIEAVLREVLE